MSMARRDFVAIAEVMHHHLDEYDDAGDAGAVLVVDEIARDLADRLGEINGGFNRERFLTACGITPPE
jgi:hypothetical protein